MKREETKFYWGNSGKKGACQEESKLQEVLEKFLVGGERERGLNVQRNIILAILNRCDQLYPHSSISSACVIHLAG